MTGVGDVQQQEVVQDQTSIAKYLFEFGSELADSARVNCNKGSCMKAQRFCLAADQDGNVMLSVPWDNDNDHPWYGAQYGVTQDTQIAAAYNSVGRYPKVNCDLRTGFKSYRDVVEVFQKGTACRTWMV